MSFLDNSGVTYLWEKIKAKFVPLDEDSTINGDITVNGDIGADQLNGNACNAAQINVSGTTASSIQTSGGIKANGNIVGSDLKVSYNQTSYAPIMLYFPTEVSRSLAAGHVSHTTTFTMPAPYKHVIGVRAVDTDHQSVLQLTTFNVNGDGASGNTVSCVAHYFNRGSSAVTTKVTWELALSTW